MSGGLLWKSRLLPSGVNHVGNFSQGQSARMNRPVGGGIWPRNPKGLDISLKTASTMTSTVFVILPDAKWFSGGSHLPDEFQLLWRTTNKKSYEWATSKNILSSTYGRHCLDFLSLCPCKKVSPPAELLFSSLFCQVGQREIW